MSEFETRQARFFDSSLDGAETEALARELELDPEGIREFIGSYRVDRLLAAKFQPTRAEAIDAIMAQVRSENHPFVQSVLRDIRALPPRTTFIQSVREWMGRYRGVLQWTLASAAVVVLALLWVWFFGPTTGEPIIAEVTAGGVTLERSGQTVLATIGTHFQTADALRTSTNAVAVITFGAEHTRLELRELTEFKLTLLSGGKRFELKSGKVEASVGRQRPFSPMIITTPQAEARVLGTRFSLSVTTNGTRLEVTEGKVRFTRASDGLAVKVSAGDYAVAAPNYELLAQPLTGRVLREYWTNLIGGSNNIMVITLLTQDPSFPDHPSGREYLNRFEAPSHWGHNYGARICGFLHPPTTGDYTFWIASGDDTAELLVSPDENPDNRQQIAYDEESPTVTLTAGRRYYIEALHKHNQGDDHFAVQWQGPGRGREVIPGEFLSPAERKK